MSMPDGRLSCTACDYRGFMVFRRITLAYHFADGTTVDAPRDIRWCSDCGNPRDTESSQPALEPLQAELDALKASSATPRYRVKRWFSRLFGLGADDLQKRADELRGQIRLAKARGDECRCLTCAGVHTFPLTFDENGVCTGFQHDCGGHLKLAPPIWMRRASTTGERPFTWMRQASAFSEASKQLTSAGRELPGLLRARCRAQYH